MVLRAGRGRAGAPLVARHEEFGKTHEEAVAWVRRSDQVNAELVAATRDRADLVVPVSALPRVDV